MSRLLAFIRSLPKAGHDGNHAFLRRFLRLVFLAAFLRVAFLRRFLVVFFLAAFLRVAFLRVVFLRVFLRAPAFLTVRFLAVFFLAAFFFVARLFLAIGRTPVYGVASEQQAYKRDGGTTAYGTLYPYRT